MIDLARCCESLSDLCHAKKKGAAWVSMAEKRRSIGCLYANEGVVQCFVARNDAFGDSLRKRIVSQLAFSLCSKKSIGVLQVGTIAFIRVSA
jgi:hypothetical protein